MAIEEIPQFEVSFYLPLFYKNIFELILSDNKNVKNMA
jgi:hypothetical protein